MGDLELAKERLRGGALAFAIAKQGVVLKTGTREGVGELLEALDELGDAARGASLADKVVGKAVAMVARLHKMSAVYSPLASEAAQSALDIDHIPLEFDNLVPLILNKRGDGPCPMERLTLSYDDPGLAVTALRDFVHTRAQAA